jgi:hypothetical protein
MKSVSGNVNQRRVFREMHMSHEICPLRAVVVVILHMGPPCGDAKARQEKISEGYIR